MAAVVSLIVVVTLGLLITRVATVALTMTGMTLQHARFQARSVFTGTGFTTSEAEAVVGHPARRRIVMTLMLVSGAGAVSVLGTLILSFTGVDSTIRGLTRAAVIVGSLTALLWLAKNRVVDRALRRVIERMLRRYTDLDVRDYAALLHLRGRWRVVQLPVEEDDWIAAHPIGDLRLPEEGIAVLGVEREDTWIGAPRDDLRLQAGDVVILYGREAMLADVAERLHGPEGDEASARAGPGTPPHLPSSAWSTTSGAGGGTGPVPGPPALLGRAAPRTTAEVGHGRPLMRGKRPAANAWGGMGIRRSHRGHACSHRPSVATTMRAMTAAMDNP